MATGIKRELWKLAQSGHLETWVKYAESGAARSEERSQVKHAMLKEVEAARPLTAGEQVLDIGCGLDTILDFMPGAVGFTLDSLMAQLKELGLSPEVRHTAGEFEVLPFADDSFDRIFLLNVLDHVRDPHAGLAEIARVLKPGGQLALSVDTYSGRKYHEKRLHKFWARMRGARTKHPWVFSVPDVQRLLERCGFRAGAASHIPGTKSRRSFFTAVRT